LSRESVSLSGVFFGETTLLFFVDADIVDVDFLAECVEYFIFDFVPRVRGVGLFFLEFGDFGVDFFDLGFEGAKLLVAMLRFLLFTFASSLYGRLGVNRIRDRTHTNCSCASFRDDSSESRAALRSSSRPSGSCPRPSNCAI